MKENIHFFPSIGNIRPKLLSTIFKNPKWCITKATTTPIPANMKKPLPLDAFNQEYEKNKSIVPTPTHMKPASNSKTRLSTAGLNLSLFLFIV
jgi:hypothetical protein